ncbi:Zn(2)-C6 fungal-type domain-containing protein [Mycena sanguinolenta]|uniref:Zn(2)-C6 fungal-type domain-containing protein n=1 Tax=Mycena sanguinolenta TaxID=230812 RepID=A0A8H7DM44_9AGAR|nr:Zn(2)-C6 fungal-type domain-containing protein [Mycena sanguinolenta]
MCDAPFFPPELEREIFETAAELYPETILPLLHVSRRVHDWIEWIQYRTVTPFGTLSTCPAQVLLDAIQSNLKPESFFRDRVRHLHISGFNREALEVAPKLLSACNAVQTLRMTIDADQIQPELILPALAALKLRRLSAYLKFIFAGSVPDCMPVLTSVTHLNIFDWLPSSPATNDQLSSWLIQFPVLTHVTIRHDSVPLARNILGLCKNLQVLIFLQQEWHKHRKREGIPWPEDDRFVWMLTKSAGKEKDWIIGSNGGMDFWISAEIFIVKKRSGEIKPSSRCWIERTDKIGCEYFTDDTR